MQAIQAENFCLHLLKCKLRLLSRQIIAILTSQTDAENYL